MDDLHAASKTDPQFRRREYAFGFCDGNAGIEASSRRGSQLGPPRLNMLH